MSRLGEKVSEGAGSQLRPGDGFTFAIREIVPFGNVDLGVAVSAFNQMGFCYGDSLDVEFSNGFSLRDIAYFSGFYGDGKTPFLYGSESFYPHVGIGCPVSGNPWLASGARAGDTVRVSLRRRAAYLETERHMALPLLLDLTRRPPKRQRANWRTLDAGGMQAGMIYRSRSPIRHEYPGAASALELMEQAGIRSVLNLSDSHESLESRCEACENKALYYRELCRQGHALALCLGVDYYSQDNAAVIARGFRWMLEQPKPLLIHCKLGLDRTGAVCALLEMLAGAGEDEVRRDYALSYDQLFGPSPHGGEPYPLCSLRFDEYERFLVSLVASGGKGEEPHDSETLSQAVRAYLRFGGMDDSEIEALRRMLISPFPDVGEPKA